MKIQLQSAQIYLASTHVDFRKGITGLTEIVITHYKKQMGDAIYIFYNRAKNKLKLLSYHRNGFVLVYKQLSKKHFTIKAHDNESHQMFSLTQDQLSWLLAGLDWVLMSESEDDCHYTDYF